MTTDQLDLGPDDDPRIPTPGEAWSLLSDLTGARVAREHTGGGCEWLIVGPLDTGAYLTITDGDAGLPVGPMAEVSANSCWLVQVQPHIPCGECSTCEYPPFVTGALGDLSRDQLDATVRRALSGGDERNQRVVGMIVGEDER